MESCPAEEGRENVGPADTSGTENLSDMNVMCSGIRGEQSLGYWEAEDDLLC